MTTTYVGDSVFATQSNQAKSNSPTSWSWRANVTDERPPEWRRQVSDKPCLALL